MVLLDTFLQNRKMSSRIHCYDSFGTIIRIYLSHNLYSNCIFAIFSLTSPSKSQKRLIFKLPDIFSI